MVIAHDAPTEALDLRRDSLQAAQSKFIAVLKELYYLQELTRTCSKFGYDLPYTEADLAPAAAILRTLARRVVEEAG